MVIHFSRANSSLPWVKDYLHITKNDMYSVETADTIDFNPTDGLKELSFSYSSMVRGYEKKSFKIISLRTGKEKVLYSNHSFLLPGEDEYASGLTVGDTVSDLYSVKIKDLERDGIKEIVEIRRIGLLLNKVKSNEDSYWEMETDKETYLTIIPFNNGVLTKSKSELVPQSLDH